MQTAGENKAVKVTLREKPIKGGAEVSLYLDYYPPIINPDNGKDTRREFLNIHLKAVPRTAAERMANADQRRIAEAIRTRRQVEVLEGGVSFRVKEEGVAADFLKFFADEMERQHGTTRTNYLVCLRRFREFLNADTLPFDQLNRNLVENFRNHLAAMVNRKSRAAVNINPNSAANYFKKFKAVLRQAYKKELIEKDLAAMVEGVKGVKCEKEFLTADEIRKLIATPCCKEVLKRAALFSIFTGLRISDVRKLTWAEVRRDGDKYFLQYVQKKTGSPEILPLPSVAVFMLGERAADGVRPFEGLPKLTTQYIEQWTTAAGITKKITFHCFRHTAATQLIENGVDIYTVQKILGHASVATTQIYARLLDDKKRAAMETINFDLSTYNQ